MPLKKKLIPSRKKSSAQSRKPPPPPKPDPEKKPLLQQIKEKGADVIRDLTSDSALDTALETVRKESEQEKEQENRGGKYGPRGPYKPRDGSPRDGSKKKSHKKKPTFTKEGILALLKLPFQVGGAITGYMQEPIPPVIEEPLAESAMQVMNDFGFEVFSRYINLGVFVALYGTCGLGWFKGFQAFQAEKARAIAEAKKPKEKADVRPEYIPPPGAAERTAV